MNNIKKIDQIENTIFSIRGCKIMLDADLADLYGTTTKRLNQQVKRNVGRFPDDFMFQLTKEEKMEVVTDCDHLRKLKFSPILPYAFTEHGAVMLASVLNSETAVNASIQVVRAFIRFRSLLGAHKELARKLAQLEKKYDGQFFVVFKALKRLMDPPLNEPSDEPMGFRFKP